MSMIDILLWIIYPYTVIAIFIMGLVWQYDVAIINSTSSSKIGTNKLNRVIQLITAMVIISGLIILTVFHHDFMNVLRWIKSIILFNPNPDTIIHTSIVVKANMLAFFSLFILLPFSNYILFISKPIQSVSSLFQKKDYTIDMFMEPQKYSSQKRLNQRAK